MNSEQIRKFFADYQVVLKRVEQLEAAMRIKAKTNLDRAASLIVERIVNG